MLIVYGTMRPFSLSAWPQIWRPPICSLPLEDRDQLLAEEDKSGISSKGPGNRQSEPTYADLLYDTKGKRGRKSRSGKKGNKNAKQKINIIPDSKEALGELYTMQSLFLSIITTAFACSYCHTSKC